jgi:GT2 family glycosyltransferase
MIRSGQIRGSPMVAVEPLKISVVIPTYRRPESLCRAVESVCRGRRLPSEIWLVGRKGDAETEAAIRGLASRFSSRVPIHDAWVTVPGHIPPVEEGVRLATGDLVAFIDDDVTVPPDWLGKMVSRVCEDRVGVVGGRVIVPGVEPPRLKGHPGEFSWYGKHWGNLGWLNGTAPIDVSGVVECNWIWRRELITSVFFDPVMNFDDGFMYGLDLCLQAREKGRRVIFDPLVEVNHHLVSRSPGLDRQDRPRRLFSYCRNYTYLMMKHLSVWRKPIFLFWWFLVGERGAWGPATAIADTLLHGFRWRGEFLNSVRGKCEGLLCWWSFKELEERGIESLGGRLE